jgi:predicted O-linked N-acetylglucosamine transferase (SPINDLY family)
LSDNGVELKLDELRGALKQAPTSTTALVALADALSAAGQFAESVACYRQALEIVPDHAALLYALGTAEAGDGQFDEAEKHLKGSLQIEAKNPHAHNNLAMVYRRRKEDALAIQHFGRALELLPDLASARTALEQLQSPAHAVQERMQSAFGQINTGAFAEAKSGFQAVLIRLPGLALAWEGLAVANLGLGDGAAALNAADEAIHYDDQSVGGRYHRALALRSLMRYDEAIEALDQALALNPEGHQSRAARGSMLLEVGRTAEAIDDLAAAVDHFSDESRAALLGALAFAYRATCDWGAGYINARADLLDTLETAQPTAGRLVVSPFQLLALGLPVTAERDAARRASIKAEVPAKNLSVMKRELSPGDKLRIGYISPDFVNHSVARAIWDLIPRHDRTRFDVEGFTLNSKRDETTAYLAGVFDQLHDLSKFNNLQAAQYIREQRLDIMIDLAGHTRGGRMEILAHRPVPVQIHAVGYGRPLGASFIPWRLTDRISTPEATRHLFDESLVDLPDNALPASAPPQVDTSVRRSDVGLPEDTFLFAYFGGAYKIDPGSFRLWMEIVRRVPEARIVFLDVFEATNQNLCRAAEDHGVPRERLIFSPYLRSPQHFGRYRLIDLCLDTLIHNGGVTTTDALWAGTPVLTTNPEDMPDRTGASLLHAARMPELVAKDDVDFVARAVEIATSPGEARRLRQAILAQHRTAALFDMEKYTRNFEAALLDVWTRDTHTSAMHEVKNT